MADTIYQQLREHLHYLGLRAAADTLAPALEAAERDKPGYTQFLHDLLATEVQSVEQRRLQGRLRFAKLPARKTIEQFDFAAQPGLDRRMVEDLATLRFVERDRTPPPPSGRRLRATPTATFRHYPTGTSTSARWGHFKPSRRGQAKPSLSSSSSVMKATGRR